MLPNVLLEGCARRTGTSREASPELGRTKAEKGPGPGGAWLSVKDQAEVGDRFLEKNVSRECQEHGEQRHKTSCHSCSGNQKYSVCLEAGVDVTGA